jgi:DNA-binding XRE family transcriptional regulator
MRLQEAGVFKKVEWLSGGGPGDIDRTKGWVDQWLGAKIRIYRKNATFHADAAASSRSGPTNGCRSAAHGSGAGMEKPFSTGRMIRKRRVASSMTQSQLAKKLKISDAYLSKIENQKVPVTKSIMQRLEHYLGDSD